MAEILVLRHRTTRKEARQEAEKIANELGDRSTLEELHFQSKPEPFEDDVKTVIVASGDGGYRHVSERAYVSQRRIDCLTMGGGSENAMEENLTNEGVVVYMNQLLSEEPLDIPKFLPGVVTRDYNSQQDVYLLSSEFGPAAQSFNRGNEISRWIPLVSRDHRMTMAAANAGLLNAGSFRKDSIIHALFTGARVKGKEIFPGQELYSDKLTSVEVSPMSLKEMRRVVADIKEQLAENSPALVLPSSLFKVSQVDAITIPNSRQSSFSLTGDMVRSRKGATYEITRKGTHPLYIAALKRSSIR